jgi:hypothetical protein
VRSDFGSNPVKLRKVFPPKSDRTWVYSHEFQGRKYNDGHSMTVQYEVYERDVWKQCTRRFLFNTQCRIVNETAPVNSQDLMGANPDGWTPPMQSMFDVVNSWGVRAGMRW